MLGLVVGTHTASGINLEPRFMSSLRYAWHRMNDSVICIANVSLLLLIDSCDSRSTRGSDASRLLDECFAYLQDEGYACVELMSKGNYHRCSFRWDRQALCRLVLTLIEASNLRNSAGLTLKPFPLLLSIGRYAHRDALVDLLYAFVRAGEDVNELDSQRWSPSMFARYYDYWPFWCEALQDSGKDIKEVLRAEGTEWLLQDDWRKILQQRYGSRIEGPDWESDI